LRKVHSVSTILRPADAGKVQDQAFSAAIGNSTKYQLNRYEARMALPLFCKTHRLLVPNSCESAMPIRAMEGKI
jgi:hypothetical protein